MLQNWANEIKRFTLGLSIIKIHGGLGERDRLASRDDMVEKKTWRMIVCEQSWDLCVLSNLEGICCTKRFDAYVLAAVNALLLM